MGNATATETFPNGGLEDGEQPPVPGVSAEDWNVMSEDERKVVRMLNQASISPEKVTNNVLKLCNVVRSQLNRRSDGTFMRKRSGTGGMGGRELNTALRTRFGTFGFIKGGRNSINTRLDLKGKMGNV